MKTVLTTCPFCACGCGLYLQAENGVPSGVAPSEHHPVSLGRLCARGWNAHEAPAWGERLTHPMVRRGGTLTAASWDEALAAAVKGFSGLHAAGKPVGVLASARTTNEESYLAARLARGALATGNVDTCLRSTYEPSLLGIEAEASGGFLGGSLADVEASEVVLVLEGDIAATHPRAASSVLKAVKAGARLVTIGCVRTQIVRLAALHLAVVPGGETELLDRLVADALSLKQGAAPSADSHGESVTGTRESSAAPAPADQVRQAVEWYSAAERASILIAPTGRSAAQAERDAATLAALAAAAGHLGRPGCPILVLPIRANLRGACELGVSPEHWPGRLPLADDNASSRLARAWGRPPVRVAGLDAEAMLREVSGLVVVAEDLPGVMRQGRETLASLEKLEFLLVMDAFATETARAAHVVLPIASFAETDGSVTSLEGRILPVRACVEPPGEAREGWKVLAELATRFGLTGSYASIDEVRGEIAKVVPAYAGIGRATGDGNSEVRTHVLTGGAAPRRPREVRSDAALPGHVLALDGVFDWGSDPLVGMSPTLARDHLSRRKLFPLGVVQLNRHDAQALGVRQGWRVRLSSAHGEAVMPVELSDELEPGVVLVPFAFRGHVAAVLGGATEAPVAVVPA